MSNNLFQKKDVTLHSGEISDFKIDCDALTDADLDCLAYLVSKKIDFSRVVSVPRGGDRFANALRKYRNYKQPPKGERSILILCDDVLTTGKSMEEKRQELISIDENPKDKIKGVVIFARGKCPDWVTPIFQLFPQSQQQENKVIEEVKEYMNDLDNYFQKEEDRISNKDLEKKIVEILKTEIHYSPQCETYVVHGAVQSLLKLIQKSYTLSISEVEGHKINDSEDKIGKAIDFENLFQQFIEFSVPTFKYATAISSLEKLDEEVKEIVNEKIQHGHENLAEEYVDCIMCLLDSAARFGIKISDLKASFKNKLEINKKRIWVKNDNNTYSHK